MEDAVLNRLHTELDALLRLVETLRGENGCPWDKKQTPQTVGIYLTEEVFELAAAIETADPDQIREELGDVLFHVVFIARMFQERGGFDLAAVAQTITRKMIRRHPHVFGATKIGSSEEVIQNWHKIKLDENKPAAGRSLLDSVPAKLPALLRAYRILDRVARAAFEEKDIDSNLNNVQGALDSLKAGLRCRDKSVAAEQIGDLLLAVANLARIGQIHPETALAGSVKRFEQRFKKMEALVSESKRELSEVTVDEKKQIWQKLQKSVS
jgi:tetrapyrrole methylase family protein / MazG family protein